MAKIGSIDRDLLRDLLASHQMECYAARIAEMSPDAKKRDEIRSNSLNMWRRINERGDIALLITAEKSVLEQELAEEANSREERASKLAAIAQAEAALDMLDMVREPDKYREAVRTHGARNRKNGLPIDACREFFDSHISRLSNILKGNEPESKKAIVRQRMDNVVGGRDSYIASQREAIDIDTEEGTAP